MVIVEEEKNEEKWKGFYSVLTGGQCSPTPPPKALEGSALRLELLGAGPGRPSLTCALHLCPARLTTQTGPKAPGQLRKACSAPWTSAPKIMAPESQRSSSCCPLLCSRLHPPVKTLRMTESLADWGQWWGCCAPAPESWGDFLQDPGFIRSRGCGGEADTSPGGLSCEEAART